MPQYVLPHFKKCDPLLYEAAISYARVTHDAPKREHHLFSSLCRTIVGQQLSGKAAHAIWEKFRTLFPRKRPTAARVLALSGEELRASGLSYAKIAALRDLSERVASRSLKLHELREANEHAARAALLEVRGIGPWSCEMFLMFALGHEDIFAPGDLGLQKGVQQLYEHPKLPTPQELEELSQRWAPYRTYAACVLWAIVDNK